MCNDESKLLEGQAEIVRKVNEAFSFFSETHVMQEWVSFSSCCATTCMRETFRNVSNDDGVRLKAGRVPSANKSEDEVSHFLRSFVFSIKVWVGQHIARVRLSANESSSTVVQFLRIVENALDEIVLSHSISNDSFLDIRRVIPARTVLPKACIAAATDDNYLAVPVSNEMQPASFLRSKKDPKDPLKQLIKLHKTCTMPTRSNSAR